LNLVTLALAIYTLTYLMDSKPIALA